MPEGYAKRPSLLGTCIKSRLMRRPNPAYWQPQHMQVPYFNLIYFGTEGTASEIAWPTMPVAAKAWMVKHLTNHGSVVMYHQ